ncbi:hypothetical protein Tco_0860964 [Tanacetum coccineum]|uniref:Uncharacterized protein n=1 Tax=Tanacetum coccineum TaxID=301880 RepID=A0ABQ5BIN1_9ASTR
MLAKAQASDASSKAKVQACGSKAKLQTSRTKDKLQTSPKTLITFGVKIPQLWLMQKRRKGRGRLAGEADFTFLCILVFWSLCNEIIVLSSDSSDDRKGPSKASVSIFEGSSVQGLLDHYGYNDIEEYISWNYFPSTDKENTDKDITDKDSTDEDCIHKSNSAMSKVCYVICLHLAFASKYLQLAFASCICSLHLHLAFAACICILHLQLAFASKHLQLAFASKHLINNDVRNDLEDFKRCMRSLRTVLYKLYERDKEIIAINLDICLDNNNSDSDNNTSVSSITSQISTSEEIVYDSPEYKGPPKNISKAKACMLAKAQASDASSKAKVQACGSKAKLQTSRSKDKLQTSPKTLIVKIPVPITNCVLGLANAKTWVAIISKTFGVKIPQLWLMQKRRKGRGRLAGEADFTFLCILVFWSLCNEIIVLSSDSSDDRKGPSKASVPIFEGSSVQGLLDHYGYNDIEEYISWNYFPSTDKENTDKDITDKDSTDEDCIHKSNSAMSKGKYVPVSQKHKTKVKSTILVTGCVPGLANVTKWDKILNKMGVRKPKIVVDKAKGKRNVS